MTTPESWTDVRLVVVDVEGNGGQPPELVELAIVPIEPGVRIGEPHEWLMRPQVPISPIVARVHGITNKMVSGAPLLADVEPAIRKVLGSDYFIAHNANVDLGVLQRTLPGWTPRGVIDTLPLARKFRPGLKSYALTALTAALSLKVASGGGDRPHRACFDALATAALFLELARDPAGGLPRPLVDLLVTQLSDTRVPGQGSLF